MLSISCAFTVSMGLLLFVKRGNQNAVMGLIIIGTSGCIASVALVGFIRLVLS